MSAVVNRIAFTSQQDAIDSLEKTLEELRAGRVVGVTVVYLNTNDEVWMHSCWERWLTGVGALHTALATFERDAEIV